MEEPLIQSTTVQQLIDLSESSIGLHSWDRKKLYSDAYEQFKTDDNTERALAMHREILLYELAANDRDGVRFHPQMSGTRADGTKVTYPDWERDFDEATVEYYRQRVQETANPALKARYADLIYERVGDRIYALTAARAYLDAAPHYYEHGLILEQGDALERALVLAAKFRDTELVAAAIEAHHEAIQRIVADKRFRPLLEIADSMLAQAPKHKAIDLALLAGALEATIQDYEANDPGNYMIRQSFLERLAKVRNKQADRAGATEAKVRLAESFVEEAEAKGGVTGGLVAAHFYEEAVKVYRAIGGNTDRVNDLMVKVEQATQSGSGQIIALPIARSAVPRETMEEHLRRLYWDRSSGEFFNIMALDPALWPSWEESVEFATETKDETPLQFLMSRKIMRGTLAVRVLTTDAEKFEHMAITHFQHRLRNMATPYLSSIFDLLRASYPVYLGEIEALLGRAEIISDARIAILRHGLAAYDRGEYVAAIHILVLQVEGVLRDLLGQLGLPTWSYNRAGEQRARMLDDILETLGKVRGFDLDLLKFIGILLNNLEGENLRNDVGHALLPAEGFGQQYAELLLLLYIKLAHLAVTRNEPGSTT